MQKIFTMFFLLGFSFQGLSQNFIMPSFPEYNSKIGLSFQHPITSDSLYQNVSNGAYDLNADISINHNLSLRLSLPYIVYNLDGNRKSHLGNIQLGISTKYWRHKNRGSVLYLEIGLPTALKNDYYHYNHFKKINKLSRFYRSLNPNDLYKFLHIDYINLFMDYAYHFHTPFFYFNIHLNPIWFYPILFNETYGSVFMINSSLLGAMNIKRICFSIELIKITTLANSYREFISNSSSIVTGIQFLKGLIRPGIFYRANFKNTNYDYPKNILGIKLEIAINKKEKYLK